MACSSCFAGNLPISYSTCSHCISWCALPITAKTWSTARYHSGCTGTRRCISNESNGFSGSIVSAIFILIAVIALVITIILNVNHHYYHYFNSVLFLFLLSPSSYYFFASWIASLSVSLSANLKYHVAALIEKMVLVHISCLSPPRNLPLARKRPINRLDRLPIVSASYNLPWHIKSYDWTHMQGSHSILWNFKRLDLCRSDVAGNLSRTFVNTCRHLSAGLSMGILEKQMNSLRRHVPQCNRGLNEKIQWNHFMCSTSALCALPSILNGLKVRNGEKYLGEPI